MLATATLGATFSSCAPEFGTRSVVDRWRQIEPVVLVAVDGYRYGDKAVDRRAGGGAHRDGRKGVGPRGGGGGDPGGPAEPGPHGPTVLSGPRESVAGHH